MARRVSGGISNPVRHPLRITRPIATAVMTPLRFFAPALSLAALLFAGCGRSDPTAKPAAGDTPLALPITVVESRVAPATVAVPGTVRPRDRAVLSAKVSGTVAEVNVTLGQRVAKGAPLARLAAAELAARVARMHAEAEQAQRDLERERSLAAKGVSAAETARAMEDRLKIVQAQLAEAETVLGYTVVTAPFDGVITAQPADVGDLASPGTPLLALEGEGTLRVEAELPESVGDLPVGTAIAIEAEGAAAPLAGKVAELSPAADPNARTRRVRIELPDGAPVRSGQFVRVAAPVGERRSLEVPASAVSRFGQMERVFVVAQGRAVLRLVKTGAVRGASVEILSGLSAGERVVTAPPPALRDGRAVEVRG